MKSVEKPRRATHVRTIEKPAVLIGGRRLQLANLDKIYWPDLQVTKGDVIGYYHRISKFILPYLKDRPESLRRNPNGIADGGFFQKDAANEAPTWISRATIRSESTDRDTHYIVCNDQATLAYLNNLGCIELNPWNSTVAHLDKPDYLILDIDPSPTNKFDQVVEAALAIKEILDRAQMAGYCKTSGASGMHVYVPIHAKYGYDDVRLLAELIATLAQRAIPRTTTLERSVKNRNGKIYLDFLQNSRGQTLAAPYSVRPVEGAGVSMPLEWREVRKGLDPLAFNIRSAEKRLARTGDLFRDVLTGTTDLHKCITLLERTA